MSWLPSADTHANISHLVSGKRDLEFEQLVKPRCFFFISAMMQFGCGDFRLDQSSTSPFQEKKKIPGTMWIDIWKVNKGRRFYSRKNNWNIKTFCCCCESHLQDLWFFSWHSIWILIGCEQIFLCTSPGNAQTNRKCLNPMTYVVSHANNLCQHTCSLNTGKHTKPNKQRDLAEEPKHPYKAPKF